MSGDPIDDRVHRRLDDLAHFAADAAYTVSLGRDRYLEHSSAGRVLRNNGRQIVIQIATVVEKLPAEFKDARSHIDWIRIARMRNLIAHHYDGVDDRLVFSALEHRIPELARALGLTDS
ncbi:HepT-like ribonuclease domain-containing protein [Microbacterium elymi]|uniref:DUF86 domain-containing protein n=1 Tax=Microbacterium elymi TaxID=2909587 RepID=A0ABY5NGM7_9MICO|nr:HepT-like ribonuclease domain-containing protein [Microbacterium elymi]UUT34325.1 DUF86 domain-containing protein [Microbacterium elymi]